MPYIGKSPSAGVRQRYQYTATAGQTTFSGTDLGNLTLTYTDNNFVDVFQNGVLLKGGGTDYTATSGTSVVLTTGASVSDVIEIIVYDVFSVGNFFNRTDSDSRYLSAAKGIDDQTSSNDDQLTITDSAVIINEDSDDVDFRVESNGNANALIVDGGLSTVGINTAAVSNRVLKIEGEGNTGAILSLNEETRGGLVEFSAGSGTELYVGSELGILGSGNNNELLIHTGVSALKIDRSGHITKPNQSAFSAYMSATQSNFAVGVGGVTILFDTERFDQNADFNTSTYTFTAPVTARYQLNLQARLNALDTAANYYQLIFKTSNTDYIFTFDPNLSADADYYSISFSILADMDASDTAYVQVNQSGGSQQTDINHGGDTYFSGYLVA